MENRLVQKIAETKVEPGSLAIFWIAQAGFVYKTPGGKIIYIDPYLSNCVNRLLSHEGYGYKRITQTLIEPEVVEANLVVCTHSHLDHFDVDTISVLARNPRLRFAAAADCRDEFAKLQVPPSQVTILEKGKTVDYGDSQLTGVYADHGALAPDALGIILQVGSVKVWQVGDSAYRPDKWQDIFSMGIDVIIPPINGAFGNLDGVEAAKLARDAHAKVAIPCHYWTFAEHGGNPAEFLEACKTYAPDVRPYLMAQGEMFVYRA
jgi:L-ascorbate 6-phosphate lactonase